MWLFNWQGSYLHAASTDGMHRCIKTSVPLCVEMEPLVTSLLQELGYSMVTEYTRDVPPPRAVAFIAGRRDVYRLPRHRYDVTLTRFRYSGVLSLCGGGLIGCTSICARHGTTWNLQRDRAAITNGPFSFV